ncbi:MAG: N-acetyl-gamma-glutamyl-phosphate reductase [Calditrichales bacterium]|nr:MAG: N-acetyl-gamma-glutamyl-phosphate reductase [Calditrichales bacterium]
MIRAGIVGGAGYTGGELIRLLLNHPQCEIAWVYSRSKAGQRIDSVHKDLAGESDETFISKFSDDADVIFLCMGHGESVRFLAENQIGQNTRIIDLSQDFRYNENSERLFVYGLPEFNRLQIMNAQYVANPGCFATAIQLALLPLAANHLLQDDIHVSGITGSTGAGQQPTETTHYSWRTANISLYKPFVHQHLREVTQTLNTLGKQITPPIRFLPFRGNFARGIFAAVYTKTDQSGKMLEKLYADYYQSHPFVILSDSHPDVKQVVNTNKAILALSVHEGNVLIEVVIDNLLKGASGQAAQNMNLMFGLEETSGLKLKATAF